LRGSFPQTKAAGSHLETIHIHRRHFLGVGQIHDRIAVDARALLRRVEDARERAGGAFRYVEPALDSARAVGRNGLPI